MTGNILLPNTAYNLLMNQSELKLWYLKRIWLILTHCRPVTPYGDIDPGKH